MNGLQQAIALTTRALVEPGDAVAMEQPGYFGAALAFAGSGAELIAIDVDREGLDVERLARVLRVRRVKLVYVTPATQSPTGVAMSPRRREALLALADEHQVPIFEDDYDCELALRRRSLAGPQGDGSGGAGGARGTFSKILFPVAPARLRRGRAPLLERLVMARAVHDMGTGVVEQAALRDPPRDAGARSPPATDAAGIYAARLAALLAALAREMPAGTTCSRADQRKRRLADAPGRCPTRERLQQAAGARRRVRPRRGLLLRRSRRREPRPCRSRRWTRRRSRRRRAARRRDPRDHRRERRGTVKPHPRASEAARPRAGQRGGASMQRVESGDPWLWALVFFAGRATSRTRSGCCSIRGGWYAGAPRGGTRHGAAQSALRPRPGRRLRGDGRRAASGRPFVRRSAFRCSPGSRSST